MAKARKSPGSRRDRKNSSGRRGSNRELGFLNAPRELTDGGVCHHWFAAVYAFDYGDPKPLSTMLQAASQPIPEQFRVVLADIVAGRRRPLGKAVAKRKLAPLDALRLAELASTGRGLYDVLLYHQIDPSHPEAGKGAEVSAARAGVETRDVTRDIETRDVVAKFQTSKKALMQHAAREAGIAVKTLESLMREIQKRWDRWPVV